MLAWTPGIVFAPNGSPKDSPACNSASVSRMTPISGNSYVASVSATLSQIKAKGMVRKVADSWTIDSDFGGVDESSTTAGTENDSGIINDDIPFSLSFG